MERELIASHQDSPPNERPAVDAGMALQFPIARLWRGASEQER
jgi:hypothetical protein